MQGAETRAALLRLKADLAEHRLQTTERFAEVDRRLSDVARKLDLIIDTLAEFRTEYYEHTHGEG